MKDYYAILGVRRGADREEIRNAYRKIAKTSHPDCGEEGCGKERFLEAQEAYETLQDPDKRRLHDEELADTLRCRKSEDPFSGDFKRAPLSPAPFRDVFEGIWNNLRLTLNGGRRQSGRDLFMRLHLTPEEAQYGGHYRLEIPVTEPCPRCRRMGLWTNIFCPLCSGRGKIENTINLTLRIPPQVERGTRSIIPLREAGLPRHFLNIQIAIDD